jgi:site-specific recombinase XerD
MVLPDTANGETIEEAIALQNFLNREKEKNPAKIDGMIKKGSITKTKTITIKKLFEEFIEYKKTERQIKEATVLDYQGTYNMLMLFCDQYENIINLDDAFFDNLITSLQKLPKNIRKTPQFKGLSAKEILKLDLTSYGKLNNKTINKYKVTLSEIFEFARKRKKYIKTNPLEHIDYLKTEDSPRKNFELSEIQDMLNDKEIFSPEEVEFLKVLLCTGLRPKELAAVKKSDIQNNIIMIPHSKSKNGIRRVPIHPIITDLKCFNQPKNSKSEYIFFNGRNEDLTQKKINPKIKMFTNGDRDKVLYSLRGNFANVLYKNKFFEPIIKKLLGHSLKYNLSFYTYNKDFIDDIDLVDTIQQIDFDIYFANTRAIRKQTEMLMDII